MNKFFKILVPLLMAALIIASIGWYFLHYDRAFTQDMLLQLARYGDSNGNTNMSSFFYDLAYEFNGQDQNVAIELANQYKADGNYTKAEYTLVNAIADGATVELYAALCNTYVEQNKILDAVAMLDNISNPDIKAAMDALRPAAPTADHEDGLYNDYISVSLSSGDGTIYYTTNGDHPSLDSIAFEEPIQLAVGETTIRSICIGNNGLVSRLSTASFTVGGIVELVEFADPAVELAIREMLQIGGNTEIYTNELWDITRFTFPADATVYTDLAYLPNLTSLTFENLALDSLRYVQGLTRLESLSLTGCRLPAEELSVLAGLPFLKDLTLNNCGLSTIAALSNAQNLVRLDIANNTIRNLDALASMTSLQELYMSHNALTSLASLSGLLGLRVLDVSYNSISSIAPVATCVSLEELNVSYNQLTDLGAINNLQKLISLQAAQNQLADISILAENVALTELIISNNAITDISALAALEALELLDFSYNQVEALPQWNTCNLRTISGSYNKLTDIDILANLPQIAYVYMDYNAIESVDALGDCYYLIQVNIYGNPVKDVSALKEHDIIVNYDPTV